MITKELLKKYASKLMFDMKDEEYDTLQKEFDVMLKQMELIGKIEGIDEVEPMTFPYEYILDEYRCDDEIYHVENSVILSNAKEFEGRELSVPKVVE